jgi:chemotaxis protein CheD
MSAVLQAPASYFDRDFQVNAVKVMPGQYHAMAGAGSITTVLGSCVSTCLWDPVLNIGGLNHFMLPGGPASGSSPWAVTARFGVYAMEVLINEMIKLGADRRRLVAKAFGGARVLQGFDTLDVGAKNVEFVLAFLKEEGIALVAKDLLGASPRKLHFFPATGKVQVKKLHLQAQDALRREEDEYRRSIDGRPGGEVEIFSAPR